MLVVASNWCVSDGTLVHWPAGRLAWLPAAIHRAALRAGFRRDGSYRPIEGVDLVLAGDTFDWLVSDAWAGSVRPWQGGRAARDVRRAVAGKTLWMARGVFGRLIRWLRTGLPVSSADTRGRPDWTAMRPAQFRLTLLAGDRDSWLTDVAPTTTRHPFSAGLLWSDGRLTVRHGHEFDPDCFVEPGSGVAATGRPPTIAESVAVDLVVPFAIRLRAHDATWRSFRPLVRLLARSRPVDMPGRLAGWATATVTSGGENRLWRSIVAVWQRSVEEWAEVARRSAPSCAAEFDAVEALAAALHGALAREPAADWATLAPRLDPSAGPGTLLLGHRDGAAPPLTGLAHDVDVGETRLDAVRSDPNPVFIRIDEGGRARWERLETAAPGVAVVTIDRPRTPCPSGGRVVDAA